MKISLALLLMLLLLMKTVKHKRSSGLLLGFFLLMATVVHAGRPTQTLTLSTRFCAPLSLASRWKIFFVVVSVITSSVSVLLFWIFP